MKKDWQQKKVWQLAQKLKAKLWQKLTFAAREQQRQALSLIDESYTNHQIELDEYKQKYLAVFIDLADYNWWEHFLYWEVGDLLTESEKFSFLARVARGQ